MNVGEPAETGRYWFDLRQKTTPYCPVDRYVPYLNLPYVQKAIGVDPGITFSRCSDVVADMFNITGDVIISILHWRDCIQSESGWQNDVTKTPNTCQLGFKDSDLGRSHISISITTHLPGQPARPATQILCSYDLFVIRLGESDLLSCLSCNWFSMRNTVLAMDWYGKKQFAKVESKKMTINTTPVAEIRSLDNFTFA